MKKFRDRGKFYSCLHASRVGWTEQVEESDAKANDSVQLLLLLTPSSLNSLTTVTPYGAKLQFPK